MTTRILLCIGTISGLLLGFTPAHANLEVAGVAIDSSYRSGGTFLQLNGAGIRSKYFINVYVGALYLEKKTPSAAAALADAGPKSMQMSILYKKIAAEKIAAGWTDGFKDNLPPADFARLAARLKDFNALFPTLHKGDRAYMDFTPGQGTTLKLNGKTLGTIEGADFFNALLRVWIGKHPADKDLKRGLLGE